MMLNLLDDSLEKFLRGVVPLPSRDVDIAFEAPDGDWAAGVSRPTINLYLWDVRPNTSEREFGAVKVDHGDGRFTRQGPKPRIDCRFLVTAWTSEVGDEHSLLGRVLVALLTHTFITPQYLQGPLAVVEPPPRIELRGGAASENPDFWSALGGQLKPGLDVVVTLTVDAVAVAEAGPPIDEIKLRMRQKGHKPEKVTLHRRSETTPPLSDGAATPRVDQVDDLDR